MNAELHDLARPVDDEVMFNKIMEEINKLNIQIALLNERNLTSHAIQLEIMRDVKSIKDEVSDHRNKLETLFGIKNFIYTNWWRLFIFSIFIFSSVELHKWLNIPT